VPGGPGERNGAEAAGKDATATDATPRAGTQAEAGAATTAVALVALIFAFWGQPSLAVVIWLVVLLLVLLGVIELVGGRAQAAPQAGLPGPPRPAVPTQTAPPH